jgi:adenylosuccinate synthase
VAVISHGVVFDPEIFLKEIQSLQENQINCDASRIKISYNCSVITRYHQILDRQREGNSDKPIGTTGKGIGPCYEDKSSRRGLRAMDLTDKKILKSKLELLLKEKSVLFEHLYKNEFPQIDEEVNRLYDLGQKIAPFLCDTFELLYEAKENNKEILYEGAQGVLLDLDFGTYPYVTSSNTGVGGIYTGAAIPDHNIQDVIGILKAYTTRVGEGPFPTEISGELGDIIQTKGNEFGATTGRKRRCGWLDLPLIKYAINVSKITKIALTKVDILTFFPHIKVCVAYEYNGKKYHSAYPGMDLYEVTPIYEEWNVPHTIVDENDQLTDEMQEFKNNLEKAMGIPIEFIAYGPNRHELWTDKKLTQ